MQCQLLERTLFLVRNRPASLTLEQIAKDTTINHNWLKAFSMARYGNPRVKEVERLYVYLSGKQLDLR